MTVVKLTQIPQLNSIVIKQEGGHFFIAAKDSIVIDKTGLLILIAELIGMGFIDTQDIMEARKDKENEDTKDHSNLG